MAHRGASPSSVTVLCSFSPGCPGTSLFRCSTISRQLLAIRKPSRLTVIMVVLFQHRSPADLSKIIPSWTKRRVEPTRAGLWLEAKDRLDANAACSVRTTPSMHLRRTFWRWSAFCRLPDIAAYSGRPAQTQSRRCRFLPHTARSAPAVRSARHRSGPYQQCQEHQAS